MFIKCQQHPSIEFAPEEGQVEPTLVHYFSTRDEQFKSALPVLAEAGEEERVLVAESPLAELVDWTIQLNRHQDFADRVLVDEKHRVFFQEVRAALEQALAKIDGIEYARLDDEEEDDDG